MNQAEKSEALCKDLSLKEIKHLLKWFIKKNVNGEVVSVCPKLTNWIFIEG
jgi:hypothetical protein